jgi:poly-gamma-glutamate synthesis protein (capsule biosynthesis protein)
VQGVEYHHGRPILYDTGDFVDDYIVDAELRNDLSGLFLLRVTAPDDLSLEVVPVRIADRCVRVAEGAERGWFVGRFTELCHELGSSVIPRPAAQAVSVRPNALR